MEELAAPPAPDWVIQLDCGHRIGLPRGAAVPAFPACVVQHQLSCRELAPGRSPEIVPSSYLPMMRGIASR